MKFPTRSTGIEPPTFHFVPHHLNHCATTVPHQSLLLNVNPYINLRNLTISVIYVSLFLQITQHCPCGYKTQPQNNSVACLIAVLVHKLCGPYKTKCSFMYYNLFTLRFITYLNDKSCVNKRLGREIKILSHLTVRKDKKKRKLQHCAAASVHR